MAHRLLATGFEVVVYNRTPAKTASLAAAGAEVAASPAAAMAAAECVLLMLSDAAAIHAVLLSEAARAELAGKTVIQMGTIAPAQSRDLTVGVEAAGGEYLEAPVLGSIPEAKAGSLLVMVGASEAQFETWQPVLKAFGERPMRVGPVGQAAALKLAMNQLIASLTTGFALSLALAQREGVPTETFMDLLRESALYAPTFDKKLDRMLARDFTKPNFPVKHLEKDVRLFLEAAGPHGLGADALQGVERILQRALQNGLSELDYSALYEVVDPATRSL